MSLELTEELKTSIEQTQSMGWKQEKVSECSFINEQGMQKYISVIGLFRQIYSISKEFDISDHHETYLFSFNLVRSSWMPHNDFLIVDMQAGTSLLGSYEISYDNRDGFTDYSFIACDGQEMVSEKFTIKINLKPFKTVTRIKITFTGFLFTSVWGITNLKFLPGCEKFTIFNRLSGNCDLCDAGYFKVGHAIDSTQISRCSRCPLQCRTCLNSTNCTACLRGYRLLANNTCAPNDDYSQVALKNLINSGVERICNQINESFFQNDEKNQIHTKNYTNKNQKPFGIVFINFDLFYNTKVYLNDAIIHLMINNLKFEEISAKFNLTNKGFEGCFSQSLERWSVQKFSMIVSNIPNSFNISLKMITNCSGCKIGVSNLNFFHIQTISFDTTTLKKIKLFSSEKEAIQNIQFSSSGIMGTNSLRAASYFQTGSQDTTERSGQMGKIIDKSAEFRAQTQTVSMEPFKSSNIQVIASTPTPISIKVHDSNPVSALTPMTQTTLIPVITPTHIVQNQTKPASTYTQANQTKQSSAHTVINQSKIAQQIDIKNQKYSNEPQNSSLDHLAFSKNGNNGFVVRLDKKRFPNSINGLSLVLELSSTTKKQVLKNQNQSVLYKSVAHSVNVPLLLTESGNDEDDKIFTFHTDKTYLNNVVTIYSLHKNIKSKLVSFNIERTDFLSISAQNIVSEFANFFAVFAWFSLFLVFVSILCGKVYLIEESIQSLQFVFFGIYIYTSYLPASIVNTISGLRRLENFDFFVHRHLESIERFLLGDLIQESPLKFTLFHKDINFIRGMIPLIFFLMIVGVWFLIVNLLSMNRKTNNDNQQMIGNNNVLNAELEMESAEWMRKFKEGLNQISSNKMDYWLQVFRVIFLPVVFLCFKQFNNFSYPEKNGGESFNMIFCLFTFISFIVTAVIFTLCCSKKYFKLEYDTFIKSFPSIYYKKIPTSYLPTESHRLIYPLLRYMKIFIFALFAGLLGDHTILIFVVMTVIFAGELFYTWFNEVYQDSLHFKFLFVESLMTGVLLLIQLILSEISSAVLTTAYLAFGYVYMSICIVLILIGLGRSGYLIFDHLKGHNSRKGDAAIGSERIV